jgi:hypothetical protein
MTKVRMHTPEWLHRHKPNWHTMGPRLDHVIHDPRFWATLALAILLTLIIITMIFSKPVSGTNRVPFYSIYHYLV